VRVKFSHFGCTQVESKNPQDKTQGSWDTQKENGRRNIDNEINKTNLLKRASDNDIRRIT
jgi:hypothetical protein